MRMVQTLVVITSILLVTIAHAGPTEDQIRADWLTVADALRLAGQDAAAADLVTAVETMTDEELYLTFGQTDLLSVAKAFSDTAKAFDAVDKIYASSGHSITRPKSPGLPGAVGYPGVICPFSPDRSDADSLLIAVDAIQIANIALEVAEGIWSVSDRACGTVVVAIGAAGNPQNAACIAADVLLFAAKAVVNTAQATVDHIAFCDGAVDSAEIEGAYERADHIHDDLTAHDTNIDGDLAAHNVSINANLATHDANIDTDLAAHDANIDADLVAHDANIDADLVAHDANIDADLITHDTDIKALLATLQGAVDENQRLIKITMARQLEIMRLLLTPNGQREVNVVVLDCTGDNCPVYPIFQLCDNGSLSWNCNVKVVE